MLGEADKQSLGLDTSYSGVLHSSAEGSWVLFHTSECLCLDKEECLPADSHLATDTYNVRA